MKALFTRISLVAGLALSAASASACPLPSKSQTFTTYERGAGYYWRTNSDGYPHLMVVDALISPRQKAGLRVSCSVMEEAIGGRFAVVSIGWGGRALAADVELSGIPDVDVWNREHLKPAAWQQASAKIRSSTVAASVVQILSNAHQFGIDPNWRIIFRQDDKAGVWVKSTAHRERYGKRSDYTITFTGDFRSPRAAKVVANRLRDRTMDMMVD